MPPPKFGPPKKRRAKRDNDLSPSQTESLSQSMPTTPNQRRALYQVRDRNSGNMEDEMYDSDTAYGFDTNWYGHRSLNDDNPQNIESPNPTYI